MAPVRRGGSLSRYATDLSSNLSVPIPAGVQAGDMGVIVFPTTTGRTPNATGWTLTQYSGSVIQLCILWKTMSAADAGTNVTIHSAGGSSTQITVAVEIWSGAKSPAPTFASNNTGLVPSATAPTSSVPLYVWAGYDTSGSPSPATLTPPAGWTGGYSWPNGYGMGLWYTAPTTGSTAPGGTVGGTNPTNNGLEAAIILAPSSNAYIAGATSAQDVLCSTILAGSTASADVTLLWTA